jgi:asparagine synthase (glutamine-hydrolysing)
MCGLAGFWDQQQSAEDASGILRRMTDEIRHRGPDDEGQSCSGTHGIALGFRRLAILDLSAEGHQPMTSAGGRYVVVYTGESYNFRDLGAELASGGARFRGHSDTEILLAAFDRWGVKGTIERVAGMFAMAIWDNEEQCLHLVRDRLGEKPLYYGRVGSAFLFGSELKALRRHPQWTGTIDRAALSLYMRYMCVPTPYSIYEGIRKVVPGTMLTVRAGQDPVETVYWSPRQIVANGRANPLHGTPDEIAAACDTLLRRTVADEMVADVPLGAFLSGGVDSSLIVALMQAQASSPVRTFTIGFQEKEYNEATHALAVAKHLGTDHTEMYVTPEDAMAVVPRLPSLYDEPFADSSQIPTFLVAQLARRHVTVSLSGDGGDEVFGGYNRYFWGPKLARWLRRIPSVVRYSGASLLRALPATGWDSLAGVASPLIPKRHRVSAPGDRAHKLAEVLSLRGESDLYRRLMAVWPAGPTIVLGAQEPPAIERQMDEWTDRLPFAERMMYLDLVNYLRDDILVKVDRATMGVSLESRAPFLDHRVVEFAWRVPHDMKMRDGRGKLLLRQVLDRYVPRHLIERPKMGFGVPIDSWLRGPMREWAADLISPERLRREGFLDADAVTTKWKEHQAGRNWQHALWTVLMFQAWRESVSV